MPLSRAAARVIGFTTPIISPLDAFKLKIDLPWASLNLV